MTSMHSYSLWTKLLIAPFPIFVISLCFDIFLIFRISSSCGHALPPLNENSCVLFACPSEDKNESEKRERSIEVGRVKWHSPLLASACSPSLVPDFCMTRRTVFSSCLPRRDLHRVQSVRRSLVIRNVEGEALASLLTNYRPVSRHRMLGARRVKTGHSWSDLHCLPHSFLLRGSVLSLIYYCDHVTLFRSPPPPHPLPLHFSTRQSCLVLSFHPSYSGWHPVRVRWIRTSCITSLYY